MNDRLDIDMFDEESVSDVRFRPFIANLKNIY